MSKSKPDKPKGILNPNEGDQQFQLSRFVPSEELQFFIEHFWIVEWDLEDDTYKQEILSYPSVQLVFEKENTWIWGVVTGKFKRSLKGGGKVLGVKFKPGGFYPFFQSSVSTISDGVLAFNKVFDADVTELEKEILSPDNNEKSVQRVERFLKNNLPEEDERVKQVNEIIDTVMENKYLIKVDQLVEKLEISKRSLQRLFKWYVGISPKWLIKRFRLHEVAAKIAEEEKGTDWAELAFELGYYDQAHFIKDFKSVVGQTPAEYARSINR